MADTPVLWKKRALLRKVGERFDVSGERIRQIKVGVARRLDDAYVRWP